MNVLYLIGQLALWVVIGAALVSAADYFRRFNTNVSPRVADIAVARERDAQILNFQQRGLVAGVHETVGAHELAFAQLCQALGERHDGNRRGREHVGDAAGYRKVDGGVDRGDHVSVLTACDRLELVRGFLGVRGIRRDLARPR